MANILIKMAEIRDLTPSERHVVEYILDHYKEVCSMGIVELGEKTFTSTTTVKRFCRKLGVDSYTDFRMLLSAAQDNYAHRSNMNEAQAPISRYDSGDTRKGLPAECPVHPQDARDHRCGGVQRSRGQDGRGKAHRLLRGRPVKCRCARCPAQVRPPEDTVHRSE